MRKKAQKRYIIIADLYILADNDESAIQKAIEWKKNQRQKFDNEAEILEVNSAPYGSLDVELIYKKV